MKVYGKNSVYERLRSQPETVKKIYIQDNFQDAAYLRQKAGKAGVPVFTVPRTKLAKLARNLNTQGIIADVSDFEYAMLHDLLHAEDKNKRTIVFLDQLNDPQNLGAIVRSLACLGSFAVILPTHDSVSVTETVLRVACGGDNYIPIVRVSNIANAIKSAKDAGYWIAGSVVESGESLLKTRFNFPLGLVVGSEQSGIRDIVKRHVDTFVTIPMPVNTMSLNVAHAASILSYEIIRQKKKAKNATQETNA